MSNLKIKLFIKVLPENDVIPCHGLDYSIVPKGKKHDEYLWDVESPSISDVDSYYEKMNVQKSSKLNFEQNPIKNIKKKFDSYALKNNRKSKTDENGLTKEVYLPDGEFDIWIKRSDSDWELAYFKSGLKGFKVQNNTRLVNYEIRFFNRYRILNFNGKPFDFPVEFETFNYDKTGSEVSVKVKGLKSNKTDKNGYTPILYSHNGCKIYVRFKFSNQLIKANQKDVKCFATVSRNNFTEVKLKSVASVSKDKKETTVNLQGTGKPPVLLNALKEEMIALSPEDYAEFEKESAKLDYIFANAKEARLAFEEAVKSGSVSNIKMHEEEIKKAEKAIEDELNKNFKKQADLTEVITFEARQKNSPNGNTQEFDIRRRYLRTDRYMQLQQKRKNKESFKVTALGKELKNFNDLKKLNKEILREEFNKVSIELAAYSKSTGTKVWDFSEFSGAFAEQVEISDNLTLDTQSQWLRCVGGAGASSSINWKPGTNEFNAKLSANAQGKLVLFEGKAKLTRCFPTEKGWMLNYDYIDLGAFRFISTVELYGFTGAKVAAGIGVEISHSKEGQKLAATGRRNKNPSLANNMSQGRPRFVPMDKDDSPISGSGASSEGQIEVFAGAEAGLKASMEFQWLSPEEKDFCSLASIAPDFAASAGIGAGVDFKLYFFNGEFRFRVKAALCVGVGAKGALDFSVDFRKLFELIKWLFYQLARLDFRILSFITKEAFDNCSNFAVLALGDTPITNQTLSDINDSIEEFNMKYARADEAKSLALSIIRQSEWLKKSPPNAKGMLIYQMTRHNKVTHFVDKPNYVVSPFLPTFKKAIIAIFETISFEGEWLNVLQRISINGKKTELRIDYIEQQILQFLHDGVWSRSTDFIKEHVLNKEKGGGSEYVEQYEKLRSKIVKTIPLHEKAPMNNPRELKKLREKIIEKPSAINEDSLIAVTFKPIDPLDFNENDADIFIAGMNKANSDDSKLA